MNNQCKYSEIDVFLKYGSSAEVFHFTSCQDCKKKIEAILPLVQELKEKTKKAFKKLEH